MDQKRGVQLYYSPRILPEDTESDNDDNNNDDNKNDANNNNKENAKKIEKRKNNKIKRFIHSIIRREKEKFHELLDIVDINGNSEQNKWTPLIWAAQKDRMYYIQQMFEANQIIDFSKHIDSKTGRTLLHFAAEKGDLKLLMLLLQKDKKQQDLNKNDKIKLEINATDREECSALFRASKVGEPLIIKALLSHKADPNITNRDGVSPLLIASSKGHEDAVKELINDNRTNINLYDERGRTPLMCACAEDRLNITKLLLKFDNINFNAIDHQNFEWNCLMWCVYRKHEKMLDFLLDHDKKKVNYFHENYHHQNVLDMCRKRKLSKKVEEKIRSKFHGIVFPIVVKSDFIVTLKIPFDVVSMLLVFAY